MKLSNEAIEAVKSSLKCRNRIAYVMDVHSVSVDRWLSENPNDGKLTTETALKIISQETKIAKKKLLVQTEQ